MCKKELDAVAYVIRVTRKKKGAGQGYKMTYSREWSGVMTRREYLNELEPRERGLFLCRLEREDMREDRWWDTDGYRDEAMRMYRGRISRIKARCGLTRGEVREFMRGV